MSETETPTEVAEAPEAEAADPTPEANSDQPAPQEGTPAEPQEDSGQSLEDFDLSGIPEDADREWFGAKYKGLQADYTRKTQAMAEERKQMATVIEAIRDPEHPSHEAVLSELGLTPETIEDDTYEDEEPDLQSRIDQLEAKIAERDQMTQAEAAERAALEHMAEQIELAQQASGREFDETELDFIAARAEANPDESGMPDVRGAIEALEGIYRKRQQDWAGSKSAPRTPGNGPTGQREVDLSNRDARLEYSAEVAERILGGASS